MIIGMAVQVVMTNYEGTEKIIDLGMKNYVHKIMLRD